MKAVMFSINRPHTDNIKIGAKRSELRTRPPKVNEPYLGYIYETLKNGGCGKVIGEFTAYNENSYRMCAGVPKHLVVTACLSSEEIWVYSKQGEKDLTEISISDLIIYDKPKELSEFKKPCKNGVHFEVESKSFFDNCLHCPHLVETDSALVSVECCNNITKPPQSWCYVERSDNNV